MVIYIIASLLCGFVLIVRHLAMHAAIHYAHNIVYNLTNQVCMDYNKMISIIQGTNFFKQFLVPTQWFLVYTHTNVIT